MNRLRALWDTLQSSLWFLPTVLVMGAVVLAVVLIEAESYVAREQLVRNWPRLFGAGAQGARGMLSAIASSMITVAGVAFSITMVTFALASNQYTSRILRTFMRDRSNQAVLGVFLGVFTYCLVVLRTIRGGDEGVFVPSLAVLGAVLLTLLAIGFLVFFIHHTAESIQASTIIGRVAKETIRAVDRLFPAERRGSRPPTAPGASVREWTPIPARMSGYVQGIDLEALHKEASRLETLIRLDKEVGDFVVEDTPLASWGGGPPPQLVVERVNSAYTTGRHRTLQQDVAFGIRQIVDIALKALSPSVNDPTTAIICLDFLGTVLFRLAARPLESPVQPSGEELRVIVRGPTFAGLLSEALDQIRQEAEDKPAVLARLLDTLTVVGRETRGQDRREQLRRHAAAVMEAAERGIPSVDDRRCVQTAFHRFLSSMGEETRSEQ